MTKVKRIEQKPVFKSGFITMVGRSNSGKSTLLNTLVGTKLAAVTHKPQTTRDIIHGVLNTTQGQAIFIDTPGILKERHNPLAGKLTERAQEALKEIDEILYVVDPTKAIGAEERFLEDYKQLSDEFTATFELSALLNRHIQPLKDMVFELLPEGMPMYEGDQITNLGKGKWIAEVIREKILLALRKEVPYSINVEVRDIEDKEDIIVIQAVILTSDARYKKMIIGAGGRSIKEIGIAARKELSTALNKKIYLELEVETDRHWEDRA